MTPKKVPEISYINLRIIQSPHAIIIDQTAQINYIILEQYFNESNEQVNCYTTPFNIDSPFEINLTNTLPDTPN